MEFELISNEYIVDKWYEWESSLPEYINHLIEMHLNHISLDNKLDYRLCNSTLRVYEVIGVNKVTITNLIHLKFLREFVDRVILLIDLLDIEVRTLATMDAKFPFLYRCIQKLEVDVPGMKCTLTTTANRVIEYTYTSLHNLDTSIIVDIMSSQFE